MGQGTLVSKTIQVLLEVIKETPLKEKLRFVPSYSIGHQVGECLSCSGGGWIKRIEKEKLSREKKALVLSDFSFSNLEKRLTKRQGYSSLTERSG